MAGTNNNITVLDLSLPSFPLLLSTTWLLLHLSRLSLCCFDNLDNPPADDLHGPSKWIYHGEADSNWAVPSSYSNLSIPLPNGRRSSNSQRGFFVPVHNIEESQGNNTSCGLCCVHADSADLHPYGCFSLDERM
jgi:hypothetical protein